MYGYHGWIALAESTEEIDEGGLSGKLEQLRKLVTRTLSSFSLPQIAQVNYRVVFQFSEARNHKGSTHAGLLSILEWICEQLPGSHGLVYWYDDEDPNHDNEYRVFVMARGKLTERLDPFLSPMNPVVED